MKATIELHKERKDRTGGYDWYDDVSGKAVLCIEDFTKLMDNGPVTKRIDVTVSTTRIPNAAEVSVRLQCFHSWWIDWDGRVHKICTQASEYLHDLLGLHRGVWHRIWVTFRKSTK